MKVPEQYRFKNHSTLPSDSSFGNNGIFLVPHWKIDGYFFNCMVSDGEFWDHVSVSLRTLKKDGLGRPVDVKRCPTWEEMCYVKSHFWEDDDPVMQLHPPKSDWVNHHPYCLHLWNPQRSVIPLPPSLMVGLKSTNTDENITN